MREWLKCMEKIVRLIFNSNFGVSSLNEADNPSMMKCGAALKALTEEIHNKVENLWLTTWH